jgi:Protein of unknown function (DUF2946)
LVHCDVTAIRLRLKSWAWVALVAMCGLSLGPSISRALAANPASAFAAHAGHHGMVPHSHMAMGHAALHQPQPDAPGRTPDGLDCCDLCVVASTPLAIVVFAIPQWHPVELATAPVQVARLVAPARRQVWSNAAPRGPPAHV